MSIYALLQALCDPDDNKLDKICLSLTPLERNEALCFMLQVRNLKHVKKLLTLAEVQAAAAENDNSALNWAVQTGSLEAVVLLLAIPSVKEMLVESLKTSKCFILSTAAKYGYQDVLDLLLAIPEVRQQAAQKNNDALCEAAASGQFAACITLLKIDEVRENVAISNNRPFRLAARNGHLTIVEELLKYAAVKANTDAFDNEALISVAKRGYFELTQLLLKDEKIRANADIQNNEALYSAAESDHYDIVLALLEVESVANKAASGSRKLSFRTLSQLPFFAKGIMQFNVKGTIKALMRKGFKLDEPFDLRGNSILHLLVAYVPHQIIKDILTENPGINLNITNHLGETPCELAKYYQRTSVQKLFRNHDFIDQSDPFLHNTAQVSLRKRIATALFLKRPSTSLKKAKIIFKSFIDYLKKKGIAYSPNSRGLGKYLLESPANSVYTANCYDLAEALGHLMKSFDFDDVRLVGYQRVKSVALSPKPSDVKGMMRCFDEFYHLEHFENNNYFSFSKHFVLKCTGTYFDPTFCISTKKYETILEQGTKIRNSIF